MTPYQRKLARRAAREIKALVESWDEWSAIIVRTNDGGIEVQGRHPTCLPCRARFRHCPTPRDAAHFQAHCDATAWFDPAGLTFIMKMIEGDAAIVVAMEGGQKLALH